MKPLKFAIIVAAVGIVLFTVLLVTGEIGQVSYTVLISLSALVSLCIGLLGDDRL